MKAVLVTGASGALGKAIVTYLNNHGNYRVIPTSRNINDGNYIHLDVSNPEQIEKILIETKPEIIIHLAASFDNNFDHAYSINVNSARYILDSIKKMNLKIRIVLIGSAAEYGVIRPEENPIKEGHALNPISVYGLTKAWQTQLAALYANQGIDVVIARVFNLDGDGLSERLFIGRLLKQIHDVVSGNKNLIHLGPLSAIRDYINLEAAVDQIIAIAEFGIIGNIYHVASGIPVSMRELLMHYLDKYKLDLSMVQEAVELSNRQGYDVPVIYADVNKTQQLMKIWSSGVKD